MLVKILSCGCLKIDHNDIEEKFNIIYETLFGMTDIDIKGFRRLRTISQLSFESFPQIILQCRILLYAYTVGRNELDVSTAAIASSLACALIHAFFEMIFVYLEAVSCKTTVMHYFIVCFNARFGWIPFIHYFSSLAGYDDKAKGKEDLNYENMKSQICNIKFQMKFKFTNSSCWTLINSLSNLRLEEDPTKKMLLSIGESMNDVDFPLIMNLMRISHNRINLNLSKIDIKSMVERSDETM